MWDVPERYQACDFSLYVLLLYTAEKNRGAAYLSIPPTRCCGKFAAGCSACQEARCLDRRYREKEECHPRRNTL